jgi:hypothetical protein
VGGGGIMSLVYRAQPKPIVLLGRSIGAWSSGAMNYSVFRQST